MYVVDLKMLIIFTLSDRDRSVYFFKKIGQVNLGDYWENVCTSFRFSRRHGVSINSSQF